MDNVHVILIPARRERDGKALCDLRGDSQSVAVCLRTLNWDHAHKSLGKPGALMDYVL